MYFSFRRILLMVLVCHLVPPAPVRINVMVKMDGIDMTQDLPYLYMAVMAK